MEDNDCNNLEVVQLHVNRVLPLLKYGKIAVSGLDFIGIYKNENDLVLRRKTKVELVAPNKTFKCSKCQEIVTCSGCGLLPMERKKGRPRGSKNKMTRVQRLQQNFEIAMKEKAIMEHLKVIVPQGIMPRFKCVSKEKETIPETSSMCKYPNIVWSKVDKSKVACNTKKKINVLSEYRLINKTSNREIAEEFPDIFNSCNDTTNESLDLDNLDGLLNELTYDSPQQYEIKPILNEKKLQHTDIFPNFCTLEKLELDSVTNSRLKNDIVLGIQNEVNTTSYDKVQYIIDNSNDYIQLVPWYKSKQELVLIQHFKEVNKTIFENIIQDQVKLMSRIFQSVNEVYEHRNISMSAILNLEEYKQ